MQIKWTVPARADLQRLQLFLNSMSPASEEATIRSIVVAVRRLEHYPRSGPVLEHYGVREVRKLMVGEYEVRYEFSAPLVSILRVFHTREDRLN